MHVKTKLKLFKFIKIIVVHMEEEIVYYLSIHILKFKTK